MRLFKISQSIFFKEDALSGIFKGGQNVTFNGFITCYNEIITGYLKQEPINDGNSLTLYVRGHRRKVGFEETEFGKEVVLVQTTKSNSNFPITMCSYFPCIRNNEGVGYLDNTDGAPSKEGKYFFICGDSIAETHIQIEEIPVFTPSCQLNTEYAKAKKKINRMLNRLYSAKFEKISFEQFKKDIKNDISLYNSYELPIRDSDSSAGYDIYLIDDLVIEPNEILKIPTGLKSYFEKDIEPEKRMALYSILSLYSYNKATNKIYMVRISFIWLLKLDSNQRPFG